MENSRKLILNCEDSYDGILTAVYDAFNYRGRSVYITVDSEYNFELFAEYVEIRTDYDKSAKVINTIENKISKEALYMVYGVAISAERDKCNVILAFIMSGLKEGGSITKKLTNPYVQRCYDIRKKVSNEAHFYNEILRFEEIAGNVLCAKISPVANVMVSVMEHFTDRFPEENFLIYDDNRRICGVHQRSQRYFIRENVDLDELIYKWKEIRCDLSIDKSGGFSDSYTQLWKVFFDSISIKERENYKLQRNNLPLKYRKHITEFL
ncbi:MAG: TIGR03915 family putative DNA repair protein [Lachnospiraceae bacterium]|nr:TIGR03915 family putative DNA repair protein [Lachnospiraceae bacterium]